jgi:hypothetical protein
MNAADLIEHCRARRQGIAGGDLRDPSVVADVLGMVLDDRLRDLASRARGPSGGIYDSRLGRVVHTEPGEQAPDAREDRLACGIATLVGYLQDAAHK